MPDRTDAERLHFLGNRIEGQRKERKLRQDQLAAQTGIDRSHISAIENGKVDLGILTLFAIARALNVDSSYFTAGLSRLRSKTDDYFRNYDRPGRKMTDEDRLRYFGKRVRHRRLFRKWTQEGLASQAGIAAVT